MLVQVLRDPVLKLWHNWELRVLILVSLTLQLCLLHLGSCRRYSVRTWLRVFLWLSYLCADSVATIALGIILNNRRNSCDCNDSQSQNELMAFWAPFLLLHLGGQDTITAYAVQDNELWLRHLLGLVVQSGVAINIILLFWKVSWLSFLTFLMFLAGFIKYAERIWVLKSANNPISSPRSSIMGHNFFVADPPFTSLQRRPAVVDDDVERIGAGPPDPFVLYNTFRPLFLNQKVYVFISREGRYSNFPISETAWKTIEDELGYAYDLYYTKAPLFFTAWGFLFRLFSFISIVLVFVLFLIKGRQKQPQIDLIITYLLLVGAVLMEIYAVILLCASDWPLFASHLYSSEQRLNPKGWLIEHTTRIRNGFAKLTCQQRWSNSIGQLNLLGFCLDKKSLQDGHGTPKLFANLRERAFNLMLPTLNRELEMLFYRTNELVSTGLKELVFFTLWFKPCSNSNGFSEEYDKYMSKETVNLETYERIIIWHIATDLCLCNDSDGSPDPLNKKGMSKVLSDYMMYILAMRPLAFSTGAAKVCFESTCKAVCKVVKNYLLSSRISDLVVEENGVYFDFSAHPWLSKDQFCEIMISGRRGESSLDRSYFGKDYTREESLLLLAHQLGKELLQNELKWEILSRFWVENLAYVATLCQGSYHAHLLSEGGEFLTHVWLLVEQLNLTERFQKSRTFPEVGEAEVIPWSQSIGGTIDPGFPFDLGDFDVGQGSGVYEC